MSDKSSVYGYYGRVTDDDRYVPPPSTPYIPQPSLLVVNLDGENAILADEEGDQNLEFEA